MMLQSPLRTLVDPSRDLPLPTEGHHARRHSLRYPCRAAARLRMERSVRDVRIMDVGYGGVCVLAPGDVRPLPGLEAQVTSRTASGVYGDDLVVVDTETRTEGTVIRFKLSGRRCR